MSWLAELRRTVGQAALTAHQVGVCEALRLCVASGRFLISGVSAESFVVGLTGASREQAREWLHVGKCRAARQQAAWRRGSGAVSPSDFAVLYAIARALRPVTVLEIGTRAGVSTTALAYALHDNGGRGVVHTVDRGDRSNADAVPYLYHRIGSLIPAVLSPYVQLHEADVRHVLTDLLTRLQPGLVFFDDVHHPEHQAWEAGEARRHLAPGAVVLCDDVTSGWARAIDDWCNCAFLGGLRVE